MTTEQAKQASCKDLLKACMRGDIEARAELQDRNARIAAAEALFPAFEAAFEAAALAKKEG